MIIVRTEVLAESGWLQRSDGYVILANFDPVLNRFVKREVRAVLAYSCENVEYNGFFLVPEFCEGGCVDEMTFSKLIRPFVVITPVFSLAFSFL